MLDFDDDWVKSYFHGKRARYVVPKDENPYFSGNE